MKEITCGNCGILYGMPDEKFRDLRKTGKTFFCPNGCSRYFPSKPDSNLEQLLEARLKIKNLQDIIEDLRIRKDETSRLKGIIKKMESSTRRLTRTKLANEAFKGTEWQNA